MGETTRPAETPVRIAVYPWVGPGMALEFRGELPVLTGYQWS